MSNQLTPSFRRPNTILDSDVQPSIRTAIQSHDNSITDLNQSIQAQATQISELQTTVSSSTSSSSSSAAVTAQVSAAVAAATETIVNNINYSGVVNNQTGVTTYTTQQNDDGALIVLSDASAIAVTLNFGVKIPWYASFSNQGAGTATLTPQQGSVNGNPTLTLPGGSWTTIYFDGANFWAESPGSTAGGVTQIIAGTNITVSPVGGIGAVTINSSGSSGTILTTTVTIAVTSTGGSTIQSVTFPGTADTNAFVISLQTPIPFSGGGSSGFEPFVDGQAYYTSGGFELIVTVAAPPSGTTYTAGNYPVNVKIIV